MDSTSSLQMTTYIIVGLTFALYIGIAVWARAGSTKEFYVAGGGVHPVLNGMATGADWMSAASFISMAGLIAAFGYGGTVFLMGWTGGYVLLAMLLAPYLRKFGKFTVPQFFGTRYYSKGASTVAVICLLIASTTYIIGQMTGVGVAFSRFLGVSNATGIYIGMGIVFMYAVFGGMKGITYTQVAQYCVLILAYTVPAIFISLQLTGNPIPQLGLGSDMVGSGVPLLQKLNQIVTELGFAEYTTNYRGSMLNTFVYTVSLMIGTAGLPHVIIRFFTVPKVRDARSSAGWALVFIAILYTTAPAVAAMAQMNLLKTVNTTVMKKDGNVFAKDAQIVHKDRPAWMERWEVTGLLKFKDYNGDGRIQFFNEKGNKDFQAKAKQANWVAYRDFYKDEVVPKEENGKLVLEDGVKAVPGVMSNMGKQIYAKQNDKGEFEVAIKKGTVKSELGVNKDIMVLANPEIAKLPEWVIALVAAGGLAAALSTAAGLLLAISSAISHDLLKEKLMPDMSEKGELMAGKIAMACAIVVAGILGLHPPDFAAGTVAIAFGLAASSIFPALMMGIFSKTMNKEGAMAGMLAGIGVTMLYVFAHKGLFFIGDWTFLVKGAGFLDLGLPQSFFLGIEPNAFGAVGALINFIVAFAVKNMTTPVPEDIAHMVEDVRIPRGSKEVDGAH